jgi:hypothetical protein
MSRAVGRGWATVDLDRAAGELRHLLPSGVTFEAAERCAVLGARCRRARTGGQAEADWIVLLEPDTEGRLAGSLARNGEGWAATWTHEPDHAAATLPGPLGPEHLVAGQAAHGPFRLVLAAATIES